MNICTFSFNNDEFRGKFPLAVVDDELQHLPKDNLPSNAAAHLMVSTYFYPCATLSFVCRAHSLLIIVQ
uniref:Uncharacterized protein n=1 Tax=Oryza punctata TaxID=4537 RepID=A0A0E0L4W9_ORYPU